MQKLKKILITTLLVLLVLIAIGGLLFVFFGEGAIKLAIETGATKAMKVGVTVEKVDISVFGGEFKISGLDINNPAGYQNPSFLLLDTAMVKADMKTLLNDEIVINKVLIDGIKITIEQKGLTSNISDLTKPMSESKKTQEQEPKEAKKEDKADSQKKVIIDELQISNITVAVKLLPVPGKSDTINLKLMPITIRDIGREKKMDIAKITELVIMKITEAIADQGSGIIPADLVNSLQNILEVNGEFILEKSKELLKSTDGIRKSTEEVKDKTKETLESIGNLFKSKKEEDSQQDNK